MRLNLSEHTFDINVRRCDVDQFDFSEVEEYASALTGDRDYQYKAIKDILIYLWGGAYASLADLANENYRRKPAFRQRFHTEEHFLGTLPLGQQYPLQSSEVRVCAGICIPQRTPLPRRWGRHDVVIPASTWCRMRCLAFSHRCAMHNGMRIVEIVLLGLTGACAERRGWHLIFLHANSKISGPSEYGKTS
ncbi:MAG: hypothetical protein ABSF45_16090 [Terriglobia bacterium]|jgi:hypothetical protein